MMAARDDLLELISALETKVQAFQSAYPPGTVLDPEDPAYADMIESLKKTNASLDQIDAQIDVEADELIQDLRQQEQEASQQFIEEEALEEAANKKRAALIHATLDTMNKPGLPTIPFEQAHAPKADRLQHLITRLSQIAKSPAGSPST